MKPGLKILSLIIAITCAIPLSGYGQTTQSVKLIVESKGFAPDTYRAMHPISVGSDITISAVGLSRNNNFEWYVNGRKVSEFSGLGQSRITLNISDRPIEVAVKVLNNGQIIARDITTINPSKLSIGLYQDHPTRGPLYHHDLTGQIRTSSNNLGLIAIPYGAKEFNPASEWNVNNTPIGKSSSINLPRQELGGQISINASYNENIFSRVSKILTVIFSNQ